MNNVQTALLKLPTGQTAFTERGLHISMDKASFIMLLYFGYLAHFLFEDASHRFFAL
jgi:hypothetical protein